MSDEEKRQAALDARMRSLIGGLDARAGFEERVMARVAALALHAGVDRENLRAQFERRRELVRRRLARDAWSKGITTAGIGVAAGALVWQFAPQIQQWMLAGDPAAGFGPLQVVLCSVVVLVAVSLWPYLRKLPGLRDF